MNKGFWGLVFCVFLACSSGKEGWDTQLRGQLNSFCLEHSKELLSENELPEYCDCACKRIESKYPAPAEVETMLEDAEMKPRLQEMLQIEISECVQEQMLSGIAKLEDNQKAKLRADLTQWNASNEKKFLKAVKSLIPKDVKSKVKMEDYCDCMKARAVQRFPQFDSITPLLKDRKIFEERFEADKQSCIVQSVPHQ
jgi:hypothetical protein